MKPIVEARQLNKYYTLGKGNSHHVLRSVDLAVYPGEFVTVMGPSGSGKSTLLYNISGMDKASGGSARFQGRELGSLDEKALSRLRLYHMGFIFQNIHLLNNLSLLDNILLTAYLAKKCSRSESRRRAAGLMEETGVLELAGNTTHQASGGQLQRVGICRALINDPEIIFGDEPTGALNSKASDDIMELLGGIHRKGTTVLLVSHDVKVAAKSERVLFMMDGQIVSENNLGRYPGNVDIRDREQELNRWLLALGF